VAEHGHDVEPAGVIENEPALCACWRHNRGGGCRSGRNELPAIYFYQDGPTRYRCCRLLFLAAAGPKAKLARSFFN
jgi:hypothetical protein